MKLRMGTRGSALALAQSGQAAASLKALHPGLEVETVVIKTSGDLFAAKNPNAPAAPAGGAKGLFVKEIEEALLAGGIDFAVHSAKDMPSELAPGLLVAAYPKREDPRDVFIGRGGLKWNDLGRGRRVATSSLRRQIQIARAKPGTEFVSMRGNVDTRLRKLSEGACEGLVLAMAGLRRLGRTDPSYEPIPVEDVVPAPAQGALALEARAGRAEVLAVLGRLDDPATRAEVELERAFLAAVGGGCSTPMGALARREAAGLRLTVFWSREDGGGAVVESALGADPAALARKILSR